MTPNPAQLETSAISIVLHPFELQCGSAAPRYFSNFPLALETARPFREWRITSRVSGEVWTSEMSGWWGGGW